MVTYTAFDIFDYEVGTIFEYSAARDWCRDGRAVIIEQYGCHFLVDTYWMDRESQLTDEEAAAAKVVFVPSEHREIPSHQVHVYGDEKVTVITRQHGSYTSYFVRADQPELTEADHYRQMLADEEARLEEARRTIAASERSIERYRAHLTELEGAS